ncbi:complex I subunit 5 family protein [Peptoclostridium acidaminophilum]|nr:proton-conducting transporter membrane subunit [Peptoclostridium acidaminophilum]
MSLHLMPAYIIVIPIAFSIAAYLLPEACSKWVSALCQTLLSLAAFHYFAGIFDMDIHVITLGGWEDFAGITLRNDHISMGFAAMAIFLWWCVLIYAFFERLSKSYLFFLLFLEGTFMGLIMSNDLFNLFVFIEVVTILSTMLITYRGDGSSLRAGFYYLLFNNAGMLFYLIAFIILYQVCGTLNLQLMKEAVPAYMDEFSVKLAYVLITAAFGVKSAFFPVYNWLPKAHSAAPSAVSALLSGLLVKSGLYEFIRLNEVFHYASLDLFLAAVGAATAMLGVTFALCQKDIKLILAFHTVSQVGIMFMGIGPFRGFAYSGGMLHLVNHAMFKALLFLCAGMIVSDYKNRNVTQIRGVLFRFPLLSLFMIVGMLSITGMPSLNGYIGKHIIADSVKHIFWEKAVLVLVNIGTAASFIKISQIFTADYRNLRIPVKKLGPEYLPLFLLASSCALLAAYYRQLASWLFELPIPVFTPSDPIHMLEYGGILAAGYGVYHFFIKKDPPWVGRIRNTDISFENACVLLLGFVCIMSVIVMGL